MPTTHKPRKGSLQFWPRKRAKRQYPRVRAFNLMDNVLPGFIGYKVGMTHLQGVEQNPNIKSPGTKFFPITVIECPPLKPFSLRFYKKTTSGLKIISEILAPNLDKELKRKITLPKKPKAKKPENFDLLALLVYTQPKLTGIGKKKPEILEFKINKDTDTEKILTQEFKVEDIFKENQFVDVHAITKGKGFQGTIKRFGLGLRSHKAEKGQRRAGNLGAWTPKKVSFRVPQPGQMGYHQRTEYNKKILKINSKPEEINPKAGFKNYGLVKNSYLLVKGSISGSRKRMIILTNPLRKKTPHQVEISYIGKW